MSTFPERLQKMREKKHPVVSRRITSELMGLGTSTLQRYERGEQEPGLAELKKIADYYGIGLDDFCWDEGEQKKT